MTDKLFCPTPRGKSSDTPRTDEVAAVPFEPVEWQGKPGVIIRVDDLRALRDLAREFERRLSVQSEITPSDEQLNALFNYYRLYVIDKAPAPDLKSLHERQRAAWDAVFGVRP